MFHIYVDLGYRDGTNITIVNVRPYPQRHTVIFKSISGNTELEESIDKIIHLMQQFKISSDSLYIPAFPAIEQRIKQMIGKGFNDTETNTIS